MIFKLIALVCLASLVRDCSTRAIGDEIAQSTDRFETPTLAGDLVWGSLIKKVPSWWKTNFLRRLPVAKPSTQPTENMISSIVNQMITKQEINQMLSEDGVTPTKIGPVAGKIIQVLPAISKFLADILGDAPEQAPEQAAPQSLTSSQDVHPGGFTPRLTHDVKRGPFVRLPTRPGTVKKPRAHFVSAPELQALSGDEQITATKIGPVAGKIIQVLPAISKFLSDILGDGPEQAPEQAAPQSFTSSQDVHPGGFTPRLTHDVKRGPFVRLPTRPGTVKKPRTHFVSAPGFQALSGDEQITATKIGPVAQKFIQVLPAISRFLTDILSERDNFERVV